MELIIAILMYLGVFAAPVEGYTTVGQGDEITNADKRDVAAPIGSEIVVPDPREF